VLKNEDGAEDSERVSVVGTSIKHYMLHIFSNFLVRVMWHKEYSSCIVFGLLIITHDSIVTDMVHHVSMMKLWIIVRNMLNNSNHYRIISSNTLLPKY
jgi:hypothetical protein